MTSQAAIAQRIGKQLVLAQLSVQGGERATRVPGEGYIAVLDAFHDGTIDVMVRRNEDGAAMMADAFGSRVQSHARDFVPQTGPVAA